MNETTKLCCRVLEEDVIRARNQVATNALVLLEIRYMVNLKSKLFLSELGQALRMSVFCDSMTTI